MLGIKYAKGGLINYSYQFKTIKTMSLNVKPLADRVLVEPAQAEEKSEFDLHLTGIGDNKVNVIKAVREITGLGLKEAKDIVDAAPKVVKEALAKADADEAMKKLTDAGATAELK